MYSDAVYKVLKKNGLKHKLYDLEQERFYGMPIAPAHKPGYFYALYRQHRSMYPCPSGSRSTASGMIFASEHAGTHIDALCHQALDMKIYGGISVTSQIETPTGFTKYGVETMFPIVTRGILLDLAKFKDLEYLKKMYEISDEEILACAEAENINVEKGDVVLLRTGYGRFWNNEDKYMEAAGVSLQASRLLADRGIYAIGADNCGLEPLNTVNRETGMTMPSHALLLVERGIYIIENLNLEKIAEDKQYKFLFICLPLKLRGATGSPIRPIAIA